MSKEALTIIPVILLACFFIIGVFSVVLKSIEESEESHNQPDQTDGDIPDKKDS